MTSLKKIFSYIMLISKQYNIDESHGMRHSMDVIQFAHEIYQSQVINNTYLINQEKIIYSAALLHDMCDKKYMNEDEGLKSLEHFIGSEFNANELKATKDIITTMSYSKVMKNGLPIFPDLGEYQLAYHIVRESDLLAAYDFDRCMIYQMEKLNGDFDTAFSDAKILFDNRVLKHFDNNLFITDKSKEIAQTLHINAINRINNWNKLYIKPIL